MRPTAKLWVSSTVGMVFTTDGNFFCNEPRVVSNWMCIVGLAVHVTFPVSNTIYRRVVKSFEMKHVCLGVFHIGILMRNNS